MSSGIHISVVIPVFQGEKSLTELLDRLRVVLNNYEGKHEVVFVHDGGSVASWNLIAGLRASNPDLVKAIRLSKNYGQNAATLCGLTKARGRHIITMDEDLQTPPEQIPALLETAEKGAFEIVYGIPDKGRQSMLRRMGSALTKRFFAGIEGIDIGSSFRCMSRTLLDRMDQPTTEHLFINQVVTWYTDRIGFTKVKREVRAQGKSGYSFAGLAAIALRLMLFYSDFPLRLMVWFGMLISAICVGFGAFFLYQKFTVGAALGFTSIIVAIFFSTGVIITCLSIIGLYIQRIFKNQMGRPVYAIEEELS